MLRRFSHFVKGEAGEIDNVPQLIFCPGIYTGEYDCRVSVVMNRIVVDIDSRFEN